MGIVGRSLDVISTLMFPKWTYEEGEEDLTVMRVRVDGRKGSKRIRYQWDLLDYYSREMNATSMARTTAFPCAIVARIFSASCTAPSRLVPGATSANSSPP